MEQSLLDLAAEQDAVDAVRAAAAGVLRRQWAPERLRAMLDDPGPGWAPDLWSTVVELGWPDLLVPEDRGGGGGVAAQFAGLAEEVGRVAAAIPFVTGAVAAWCAGPSLALRTVALAEPRHADDARPRLTAREEGPGFVVEGTKSFVPYGAVAESCVVSAVVAGTDEIVLFVVDTAAADVEVTPLRALDASPLADLEFHGMRLAPETLLARGPAAARLLDGVRARLGLGWASELVGIAAAVHDAATEYARHRVAFGRPIGAFQAIKHRLVDLRGDIEVARALVNRAARAIEHDAPDAEAMVALSTFWAAERLRAVPEGAIQVFGGIGYTWEHDAHLYLRRAAVLTALLPSPTVACDAAMTWLTATR
jgi:alkylation response protein AidB-like acyl-CoA dehydrogenase